MSLREAAPMTQEAARLLNPLQLAHIGDTVWEMLVRTRLVYAGRNLRHMHQDAVAGVNAAAQARALGRIAELLSETEQDVVRRGRNSHARHPAPRHQDPADYQAATALEALMGYLYLTGQDERIRTLFDVTQREDEPCRST